ncbi:hypothetical protein Tco_0737742 [Tanacetum coccineum]
MKNNQISLFTKPSTFIDDLSDMDLKLKLLYRIHKSKSNTTHPTNQKLYVTLYESVYLDHDALNDQDTEPSFHKRNHDNQDPPNNREGENRKKCRNDVGEPSSRSSRMVSKEAGVRRIGPIGYGILGYSGTVYWGPWVRRNGLLRQWSFDSSKSRIRRIGLE